MLDKELAEEIVTRLNKLIENPEALDLVDRLINNKLKPSKSAEKHYSLYVHLSDGEGYKNGFMGLLNSIVGPVPDGPDKDWGYVCALFDSETNKLIKFRLTNS